VAFPLKYVRLRRCPAQHRISMKRPLEEQQTS